MPRTSYAIAIGSNRCGHHGRPEAEVRAAIGALAALGSVRAASPLFATAPIGPSARRFANAALLLDTAMAPVPLLAALKAIERDFGRRPGRRWGERVLDLDIILWSGGARRSRSLTIPHPAFRQRRFVLDPLAAIARDWRDPVTGRTAAQLAFVARMVDRRGNRS